MNGSLKMADIFQDGGGRGGRKIVLFLIKVLVSTLDNIPKKN